MKVLENTPSRLVLEIRPIGLMVLCIGLFLLFLVLGFGMRLFIPSIAGVMGMPDNMPGLNMIPKGVPGMNVLGYASVIPLLIGVFYIKTRRLGFDRTTGQITLNTRGVLGRGEKTYSLAAFQGASLAASHSNNSTSYRAMLHFSDATGLVPVTPYGTGGGGPSQIVNAINRWFGTGSQTGPSLMLQGAEAVEAMAALEKLGFKIQR